MKNVERSFWFGIVGYDSREGKRTQDVAIVEKFPDGTHRTVRIGYIYKMGEYWKLNSELISFIERKNWILSPLQFYKTRILKDARQFFKEASFEMISFNAKEFPSDSAMHHSIYPGDEIMPYVDLDEFGHYEVFYVEIANGIWVESESTTSDPDSGQGFSWQEGWYYWIFQPGFMPEGEPNGPHDSEDEARNDINEEYLGMARTRGE